MRRLPLAILALAVAWATVACWSPSWGEAAMTAWVALWPLSLLVALPVLLSRGGR